MLQCSNAQPLIFLLIQPTADDRWKGNLDFNPNLKSLHGRSLRQSRRNTLLLNVFLLRWNVTIHTIAEVKPEVRIFLSYNGNTPLVFLLSIGSIGCIVSFCTRYTQQSLGPKAACQQQSLGLQQEHVVKSFKIMLKLMPGRSSSHSGLIHIFLLRIYDIIIYIYISHIQ